MKTKPKLKLVKEKPLTLKEALDNMLRTCEKIDKACKEIQNTLDGKETHETK